MDEKRTICPQALTPGVSVAQVARRYAMNANLIFKWLKDPRFAPPGSVPTPECAALDGIFLPVEIDALPTQSTVSAPPLDEADHPCSVVTAQRVDITLSDGRRILVEGPTPLSSVVGLIHGLTA
tara:strand:+ start:1010 stop:1381 length:372 start_codon:yes stop_codon:yes gene_type:complete